MLLWLVRSVYFLLIMSMLLLGFTDGGPFDYKNCANAENIRLFQSLTVIGSFAILMLGLCIDLFLPKKKVTALAGVFFGVLVGLLIGMSFNYIIDLVYEAYNISSNSAIYIARDGIKSMINILCCYLTILFIMQTKDDFRFIIPYVEFSKQTKGNVPFILDTSVIIDGRIADIAATKIMNSPIIVPRYVLNELQHIADSADRLRRNRGRRGLDILKKMQTNKELDITIQDLDLGSGNTEPVDQKLVATAQKLSGKIVTNDYNLNKVASLRGIDVINVNDLANALKTVVLPGEMLTVKITKPGDQSGQGIGYLDDGTMIVVEMGRSHLGEELDVAVTSVLQTSAGRMIFSKMPEHPNGKGKH